MTPETKGIDAEVKLERRDCEQIENVQHVSDEERLCRIEAAIAAEHKLTILQGIKLYPKAAVWSLLLSIGVIMDGFDLVLIGNFIGYPTFQQRFGVPSITKPGKYEIPSQWQAGLLNSGKVGQIIGLLLCGYLSERFGYKKTMIGTLIYLTGIIFMFFYAMNLEMLVATEVLAGIPFGIFNVLSIAYASDVTRLALRPFLTTWTNCCWGIGQLIALGALRGLLTRTDDLGWKIPFALQWMWIPPLALVALFCPESPWWLVRQNRTEDAKQSLERLMKNNSNISYNTDNMVFLMQHTYQAETAVRSEASYLECFRGTNLRRTEIVCIGLACQVMSGNVLFSILSYFLQQAGLPSTASFNFSLANYSINILGTFVAWSLTAWGFGRRRLYITGLLIMAATLVTLGGVSIIDNENSAWGCAGLLLFWTVVYQSTVGTLGFALGAEIPARKLLLKTINLGRAVYSVAIIIANSVNPYMINSNNWNWRGKAGFFWAGACLIALAWTFFRLPEVNGLTYHEINSMFEEEISAVKSSRYARQVTQNQTCQAEKLEGK